MLNKSTLAMGAFLALVRPSIADPFADRFNDLTKEMNSNLSADGAACAAFYWIGVGCLSEDQKRENTGLEQQALASVVSAHAIASGFGNAIGLSEKAVSARQMLAYKSQMKEIDNECVNFAVLLLKYADLCKMLIDHTDIVLKQRMDQVLSTLGNMKKQ